MTVRIVGGSVHPLDKDRFRDWSLAWAPFATHLGEPSLVGESPFKVAR